MTPLATTDAIRPSSFGQRRLTPRVVIADSKPHIRTFLADTLEDLGFIVAECPCAGDLPRLFEVRMPDLVVIGLTAGGIEARQIMETLAATRFDGQVLPLAVPDSVLAFATRQYGRELGIAMLPTLATPFSADTLRQRLTPLIPAEAPPSPAVDVAEALKAGWLELWYQRKIDLGALTARGAEALIRMRHPAWGVVPPAHFIPDCGDASFRNLSDFVVRRVIEDWRYFLERHGPIDLAINLPFSFLQDAEAVNELCRKMPQHAAFSGLTIELKSSEVIGNLAEAAEIARRVRFSNIGLAIEDLGTEWPALMDFDVFPFVELKVAQPFVAGCGRDRLKQTVCRGVVDLAARHGVRTVAEGIETRDDFITAHQLGFDLAQGFLFGKPMAAQKFARSGLAHPVSLPA